MYYLVETKPDANVSQFKAALSRNGIKYRVDEKLPNYMAVRSTRSLADMLEKYSKYIEKIEETQTRSLIEVIELVYLRRPQAPIIRQSHPVSDKVENNQLKKEPGNPVLISQSEPIIKKKLDYILSLVFALIGRRNR